MGSGRKRQKRNGKIWDGGKGFIGIPDELLQSNAFTKLSGTATKVLLRMIARYEKVSRRDTVHLEYGFAFTHQNCLDIAGEEAFRSAMKQIVRVGLFEHVTPPHMVARGAPYKYRPSDAWQRFELESEERRKHLRSVRDRKSRYDDKAKRKSEHYDQI